MLAIGTIITQSERASSRASCSAATARLAPAKEPPTATIASVFNSVPGVRAETSHVSSVTSATPTAPFAHAPSTAPIHPAGPYASPRSRRPWKKSSATHEPRLKTARLKAIVSGRCLRTIPSATPAPSSSATRSSPGDTRKRASTRAISPSDRVCASLRKWRWTGKASARKKTATKLHHGTSTVVAGASRPERTAEYRRKAADAMPTVSAGVTARRVTESLGTPRPALPDAVTLTGASISFPRPSERAALAAGEASSAPVTDRNVGSRLIRSLPPTGGRWVTTRGSRPPFGRPAAPRALLKQRAAHADSPRVHGPPCCAAQCRRKRRE